MHVFPVLAFRRAQAPSSGFELEHAALAENFSGPNGQLSLQVQALQIVVWSLVSGGQA